MEILEEKQFLSLRKGGGMGEGGESHFKGGEDFKKEAAFATKKEKEVLGKSTILHHL